MYVVDKLAHITYPNRVEINIFKGVVNMEQVKEIVKIAESEVRDTMVSDGHEFATVIFLKRSNGEYREMNYRLGVKKHLKGGTQGYDPKNHNLITVWETSENGGYKCIPLDGVQEIHKGKIIYKVSR